MAGSAVRLWFQNKQNRETVYQNYVTIPDAAIEETRTSYGFFRGLNSPHTRDLLVMFIVVAIVILFILILQLYIDEIILRKIEIPWLNELRGKNDNFSYSSLFFPAAVTVVVGALLTFFQIGKRRFASVDLFSMEMLSIIRLIAISEIIPLSEQYCQLILTDANNVKKQKLLREIEVGLAIFGEDNFAEVFVNNTSELGWLDSKIVDYATGYYTFVRSIHNLTESFKASISETDGILDDGVVRKYIIDICYVIDTAMDNGYRAFEGLIQSRYNRQSAQQSALYVGTRANNFLLLKMLDQRDGKYTSTERRFRFYKSAIQIMGV